MAEYVGGKNAPLAALPYETLGAQQGEFAVLIGWVGLRLLSIYLMLQITHISALLSFIVSSQRQGTEPNFWVYQSIAYLGPYLIDSIVGIVLFRYSRPLARRMFSTETKSTAPARSYDVMVLTLSGVGLFMCLTSLPAICGLAANWLSQWVKLGVSFGYTRSYYGNSQFEWIGPGGQMLIGLVFFIYASRFTGWWQRVLFRRQFR